MLRAAIARGLSALMLGLALPASAQSYQSSFSEVKFDRAKGASTFHGGLDVDAATGAVSVNMPMGPGIGERGLKYNPLLTARFAPQFGISSSDQSYLLYTGSSGGQLWGTQTIDTLYQRGGGTASFSTGSLDMALKLTGGIDRQTSYTLPGGGGGAELGTVPSAVNAASVQALLAQFGYGANDTVGYMPGNTTRTTKVPYIQMGSTGHLVVGLRASGPSTQLTDEVSDWIQFDQANSGGQKWDFPRRVVVIQGDVAYEFRYLHHVYQIQNIPYLANNTKQPLFKSRYLLTKVLNRFGERLDFTYDADAIGYTVTWSTNPSVKIRVAVVNMNVNGSTQIRVTYQGISQPVSTYLVEVGALMLPPSWMSAPGSAVVESPSGQRISIQDGDWDAPIQNIQPTRVTQEATSEAISFGYATADISTSWGGLTMSPQVLSSVTYPTRKISLHWNPYWYRANYSAFGWSGMVPSSTPRRPAICYGVDKVTDTETVTGVSRNTLHTRVVPQSNWATSSSDVTAPDAWTDTTFYDAITHPDGTVSVHRFVEPLPDGSTTTSTTAALQTLAFLKNMEREVREYEPGVDWRSDLANAAGSSSSTAYKVVVKDRFDLHSVGNPLGTQTFKAVPYPTRTRTWDRDTQVMAVEETTDWDGAQFGWTATHKTAAVQSTPSLAVEYSSLATTSTPYQAYPAAQGGERVTVRSVQSDVSQWFIGRVVQETPTSQQDNTQFLASGVALPQAQPPVAKTFDPAFNTLKSVTLGANGGLQVTTTFAYQGAAGLPASELQSVSLSGAGLDLSGQVGVSGYGYDANGFMSSISQKPNAATTITMGQSQDELGRPTTQTDPNGKVLTIGWDAAGRFSSLTPPDGDVATAVTYNDTDHRTVTLTRGAQVTEYRYNGFGELSMERRKDVSGAWSFKVHGYDSAGRAVGESVWIPGTGDADEANWSKPNFTTSATITTTTPGTTRCTQWGYDDAGNRVCLNWQTTAPTTTTTTLSPLYNGTLVQYDLRGRVILTKNANGLTTQTAYLGAANAPVVAGYSPSYVGPMKKVTVAPGTSQQQVTVFESDALGRLVRITDALNQRTEYRYDAADRILLVSQFDALGHEQRRNWAYNELGWLTSLTQPESGLTTYTDFTVTGKPKTTSYAGRVVRTTFDAMMRPLSVVSDDGSVNQTFTYDTAPGGLGKPATSNDGGSNGVSQTFAYGAAGNRLIGLLTTARGQSFTQSFGYDSYGNRTSGSTSHGSWAQTYHGATGLPNVLSYGATTVASTPWSSYDPTSWMIKTIAYGNGVSSTFGYDVDQLRLKSVAHLPATGGPLAQWSYDYDSAGNMIRENDLVTGSFDQYGYDNLNRLVSALIQSPTYGDQLQSFTYDAFGNRASGLTQKVTGWSSGTRGAGNATVTATSVPTVVNAGFNPSDAAMFAHNQMPATTTAGVATGALYDSQGNLTQVWAKPGDSSTQLTMTYDTLGRVTTLGNSKTGTTETYAYTAAGLRTVVEVRQGGVLQKTKFNVYSDARQLVAMYEQVPTGALTWKRDIVYLGSREAAEFDATGMHVTQVDHLGSPRVVTGPTGAVESRQKYLPFGELLEQSGTLKTAKGYTNHEQTDDSGLIYMQARFYLPWVGRFSSPDPARDQHFELTQSWNIYSYVRNSPILSTDPTGMVELPVYAAASADGNQTAQKKRERKESKKQEEGKQKKDEDKGVQSASSLDSTNTGAWNLAKHFIYSQSTGSMSKHVHWDNPETGECHVEDVQIGKGYAGGNVGKNPEGVNSPDDQDQECIGPLPQGRYTIESASNHASHSEHKTMGPNHMPLTPDSSNEMFGRTSFYIHGDNSKLNQSASKGCIVLGPAIRAAIVDEVNAGFNKLYVTP